MEKILLNISKRGGLSKFLQIFSHAATVLSVLAFGYLSILALRESAIAFLELCIILGVPFLAVTVIRKAINAPRPYEVYDFYESPPKDKKGVSFPSRHTFLVFAIATVCMPASAVPAIILLVLGVLLAVSRVLIGIHFIRDVVTGAMLGILSSVLGLLILNPF